MPGRRRTKTPDLAEQHTLPAVHALHLAELVERWQVAPAELLGSVGMSAAELLRPEARLSIAEAERLVERACALTGEPGLGFYLGLQMRVSAHGYLGFAAMTAGTLREALEVATRFAPTRTTALGLRLELTGGEAALILEEHAPLGRAREVVIFALLVGIWHCGGVLTGGRELAGRMDLAFPEPDYFPRFAQVARGQVRFGQPAHRLVFDAALLELPLTMADPVAQHLAREQCQRELDALGYRDALAARVRELLPLNAGSANTEISDAPDAGFRAQADIARRLHTSVRTLKRRLAAEGTSYSALLDEARRERALLLLRGALTAEEVADRLGYSDAANFTRAFRRWTGTTPRSFRREAATATATTTTATTATATTTATMATTAGPGSPAPARPRLPKS